MPVYCPACWEREFGDDDERTMVSACFGDTLWRGACGLAFGWCLVLPLPHWVASAFSCGFDTSYCAESRHKNGLYRGVLVDQQGRRLTNMPFSVDFETRRGREGPSLVDGFATDGFGNYCVVWARERIIPRAYVDERYVAGIDGRWEPLNGSGPPRGCQEGDEGIPWNRADDRASSPQFISVFVLTLTSIALLLVGLGSDRRHLRGACRSRDSPRPSPPRCSSRSSGSRRSGTCYDPRSDRRLRGAYSSNAPERTVDTTPNTVPLLREAGGGAVLRLHPHPLSGPVGAGGALRDDALETALAHSCE